MGLFLLPTLADVQEFRAAQAGLGALAARELDALWASLDLSHPEQARDALLEAIPALTVTVGLAAATVAADWYDLLRAEEGIQGRFRALMADPYPVEAVQERVRFGAAHLFTDTPGDLKPFLDGAVQKYALQPARDTVSRSTVADPRAVGWQRHTRGASCSFCRLLAGRGGVYRRETAHFAAHGSCDCVAAPSWDQNAPEVPASAYVASVRTSGMSDRQRQAHRARVREYLAAMGD